MNCNETSHFCTSHGVWKSCKTYKNIIKFKFHRQSKVRDQYLETKCIPNLFAEFLLKIKSSPNIKFLSRNALLQTFFTANVNLVSEQSWCLRVLPELMTMVSTKKLSRKHWVISWQKSLSIPWITTIPAFMFSW